MIKFENGRPGEVSVESVLDAGGATAAGARAQSPQADCQVRPQMVLVRSDTQNAPSLVAQSQKRGSAHLFDGLFFRAVSRFTTKLRGRQRDFPCTFPSHTPSRASPLSTPPWSPTCVTVPDLTLTPPRHPDPLWTWSPRSAVPSMGSDSCKHFCPPV